MATVDSQTAPASQVAAANAALDDRNAQPISLGPIPGPFVPNVPIPTVLDVANQAAPPFQPIPVSLAQLSQTPNNSTSAGSSPPSQQAATQSAQNSIPGQGQTAFQTTIQGTLPSPTSFIGQIPFFLNAILSTPAGALPKGPLWVVVFDFDSFILNTIKSVKQYEPRMPEPWLIDQALNTVTTARYQTEKGCMFAQSVAIPGEALAYGQEGIKYNAFIRGGVGQGRENFDPVRINFLNTNVNFIDNVIRPWVVMTGHLGMIARPRSQKYRCNLTIYKLGIDRVDRPPFIAQQFNFWEVCPINVLIEELNYSADGNSLTKAAEFVYQWYTTTSYKNPFATAGIEASPQGGPDVRRGTIISTAQATTT
jgi:hypothetical protein